MRNPFNNQANPSFHPDGFNERSNRWVCPLVAFLWVCRLVDGCDFKNFFRGDAVNDGIIS